MINSSCLLQSIDMVTGHTLLNTINSYMDCTTSYVKHWHITDAQIYETRHYYTTTITIHHCCITANQARATGPCARARTSEIASRSGHNYLTRDHSR